MKVTGLQPAGSFSRAQCICKLYQNKFILASSTIHLYQHQLYSWYFLLILLKSLSWWNFHWKRGSWQAKYYLINELQNLKEIFHVTPISKFFLIISVWLSLFRCMQPFHCVTSCPNFELYVNVSLQKFLSV